MSKRLRPDLNALNALLADTATPMADAAEPAARFVPQIVPAADDRAARVATPRTDETATANLKNLGFKVPASFRQKFLNCARQHDLKLNELLFQALAAWETQQGKN